MVTISPTGGGGGLKQVIPVAPGEPHVLALPDIGANGFVYLYDAATLTSVFAGFPLTSASGSEVVFTPTGPQVTLRLFALDGTSATFDNLSIKRQIGDNVAAQAWGNLEWASFGDSLVAQTLWQPHVAGELVLRNTSHGFGGVRLDELAAQVGVLPTTARLVTVLAGVNDWVQARPLAGLPATLDTLHAAIAARCPLARIAYMTPPYSEMLDFASRGWADKTHNTLGLTIADYAAAIASWATGKGYPLFDVNTDSGIDAIDNRTYMTDDGNLIHPNAAGGALVGGVVVRGLQGILPL